LPSRCHLFLVFAAALVLCAGCTGTGGSLGTLQTQNRTLLEQNRAQIAEIENLKSHSRRLEDKLIDAEQQLALLEQRMRGDGKRLAAEQDQRASAYDRSARQNNLPDATAGRDGRSTE
jgi:uncharacterized protein HemX